MNKKLTLETIAYFVVLGWVRKRRISVQRITYGSAIAPYRGMVRVYPALTLTILGQLPDELVAVSVFLDRPVFGCLEMRG